MAQLSFEQFFRRRNPQYVFLINRMRAAMSLTHVTYDDITSSNLRLFLDYMHDEVSANSLRLYCAVIKATINECAADGLIHAPKCTSVLKVKSEPQQNVALSDNEIRLFEQYYDRIITQAGNQVEKDVLTLFLLEIYSGARGIDVESLTSANVVDGQLSYVSKKTHTLTTLPAHRRLLTLIARKPAKQYSRMTKNRTIKRVAQRIGITQPVTIFYHGKQQTRPKCEYLGFHCARRSFVSSLIDMGVPISTVSRMAGHSDIKMTFRYYQSDKVAVCPEAMAFFNS